jgi:hypothetical protein
VTNTSGLPPGLPAARDDAADISEADVASARAAWGRDAPAEYRALPDAAPLPRRAPARAVPLGAARLSGRAVDRMGGEA